MTACRGIFKEPKRDSRRSLISPPIRGIAVLVGFSYLCGRHDEFIYKTPHMQRRLRRWGAFVAAPAPASQVLVPLSTLEPTAFQRDESVDTVVLPDPAGVAGGGADPQRPMPPASPSRLASPDRRPLARSG